MNRSEIEHYERFSVLSPDLSDEEIEAPAPNPLSLADVDGKKTLVGYAVVWGAISDIRKDGKRHQFQRGSITWADQVSALWSHDIRVPLAGTQNKTLRIVEDDYGAKVEIDLDQTSDGQNAYIRVADQLVTGMSFGGARRKQDYKPTSDPQVIQPFNFLAEEVTLTYQPGMRESRIVTSQNSDNLEKERNRQLAKNKLNTMRLAILRPQ